MGTNFLEKKFGEGESQPQMKAEGRMNFRPHDVPFNRENAKLSFFQGDPSTPVASAARTE
jgi:hypothetical protein